jgi:hypothetical protein
MRGTNANIGSFTSSTCDRGRPWKRLQHSDVILLLSFKEISLPMNGACMPASVNHDDDDDDDDDDDTVA